MTARRRTTWGGASRRTGTLIWALVTRVLVTRALVTRALVTRALVTRAVIAAAIAVITTVATASSDAPTHRSATRGHKKQATESLDSSYDKALNTLASGHAAAAAAQLQALLAAHPQQDDARLLLGELLLDDGQGAEASALLQTGFATSPARFGLPLARALLIEGRANEALALLQTMPEAMEGETARHSLIDLAAQTVLEHSHLTNNNP